MAGDNRQYLRRQREQEALDPWNDISDDWKHIGISINTALIRYLVTIDMLTDIAPKAAARTCLNSA